MIVLPLYYESCNWKEGNFYETSPDSKEGQCESKSGNLYIIASTI